MKREAGVLMSIQSLPSEYGVGDFGPSAYRFVDDLAYTKAHIWQILPLNPLGFGESPYQPYSSFAMDSLYVSVDELVKEKLIESVEPYKIKTTTSIDYPNARIKKDEALKEAYINFNKKPKLQSEFDLFLAENKWVTSYALFISLKKAHQLRCWLEWEEELQDLEITDEVLDKYKEEIRYESYVQFILFKQWFKLKKYANKKNIKIMGDIPIYVGIDSCDVWQNKASFLLDEMFNPTYVAGVPPDYFSEDGQLWGNPLYDWDYLKETDYKFWVDRLETNAKVFDIIRIDHFRAFDTYWKIPYGELTARNGEWIIGPREDFFNSIFKQLPDVNIVVEDLGDLRPEVYELRDEFDLAGMKIVQFTFDPKEHSNFVDKENQLVYTGTHDNQTIISWYKSQSLSTKRATTKFMKEHNYTGKINEQFIKYTFDNLARIAIIPIQDIIGLDDSARINTPGTVGAPNWCFKLENFKKFEKKLDFLKEEIRRSKRK